MAISASPTAEKSKELRRRLDKCWEQHFNWDIFPETLRMGCQQIGQAKSVPPSAILGGLLIITSFMLSPAVVQVPGTDWAEPALVWLTISMPTGSRKSTIYQFLCGIIREVRRKVKCKECEPEWTLQDATFEKMGVLMAENSGRLLGIYDELSSFLAKLNLYRGRGLSDSHEVAMFLELYNANPWTRSTGEANFSMSRTNLTVGGFNQPAMTRSLIELLENAEKGLSQRFLWMFPQPVNEDFQSLQEVDQEFVTKLVDVLAKLWKPATPQRELPLTVLKMPTEKSDMESFISKYNATQKQLKSLSVMDDLLSGMLSKSLGQILRVAASMNVLFQLECREVLQVEISKKAIDAAIYFVETCCQETAFIAGRGNICEEIRLIEIAKGQDVDPTGGSKPVTNEAYCLMLSGKILDLSSLSRKEV